MSSIPAGVDRDPAVGHINNTHPVVDEMGVLGAAAAKQGRVDVGASRAQLRDERVASAPVKGRLPVPAVRFVEEVTPVA